MSCTRARNERPARPLSAYNLWFRHERQRLLQERGEMVKALGFTGMAKYIGQRWKKVSQEEKKMFQELAAVDKERYRRELADWYQEQEEFIAQLAESEQASPCEDTHTAQPNQTNPRTSHANAAGSPGGTSNILTHNVSTDSFSSHARGQFAAYSLTPLQLRAPFQGHFFETTHQTVSANPLLHNPFQWIPTFESQRPQTIASERSFQAVPTFNESQSLRTVAEQLQDNEIEYLLAVLK